MHITLVHVRVKPEAIDAFIAATRANHEASIQEAGNRRFDVLQSPGRPAIAVRRSAGCRLPESRLRDSRASRQ